MRSWRRSSVPKIVVLGEALIDLFADEGVPLGDAAAFRPLPGGAPANVAVALGRLGASVGFVGKVGDDAFGELLQATLASNRVDTRYFDSDAGAPTMLAVVAVPTADEPQFILYNGANELLRPADVPTRYIERADVFVFGSVTLATRSREAALGAAELARNAGNHVIFDVNLRPALWPDLVVARTVIETALRTANIVKANGVELEFLTGTTEPAEGCRALLDRGAELCCISLGNRGAYFANGSTSGYVSAFDVESSDTTGCGDAFVAGLALKLSELRQAVIQVGKGELNGIVRFANACGAIVATQEGAMSAELDLDVVRQLMEVPSRTKRQDK